MYKKAVLRGIAASPFASTKVMPIYLLIGTTRKALVGASVRVRDNQAKAEEYGLDRKQEITARIPKNLVTAAPRRALDKLEYAECIYDIDSVTGDADHSACWIIKGSCPTP
jgi:hypothetical protein